MKWNWTTALFSTLIAMTAGVCIAGPVNVNTADAKTIAKELLGIGESRAAAIVAWRLKNGRFESIQDLQNVKGVGQKILRQNKGNILFDDPETDSD